MSALTHLPIYFDARACPSLAQASPSARKPLSFVDSIQTNFPGKSIIHSIEPVSIADLERVHDPDYVEAIFSGDALNGFGNHSLDVAQSLRWTSGALRSAILGVLDPEYGGPQVACAPFSGFHHAHHDHAEGFCTFNGLVVAAESLQARGIIKRAAILDLDYHYGNGTDELLELNERRRWLAHFSSGLTWLTPAVAEYFLASVLPSILQAFAEFKTEVLIYQAGADAHIDDPLGGWMTTAQLAYRDQLVFSFCRDNNIPVVWCLAGGYQRPLRRVLDIHDQTFSKCLEVYR